MDGKQTVYYEKRYSPAWANPESDSIVPFRLRTKSKFGNLSRRTGMKFRPNLVQWKVFLLRLCLPKIER